MARGFTGLGVREGPPAPLPKLASGYAKVPGAGYAKVLFFWRGGSYTSRNPRRRWVGGGGPVSREGAGKAGRLEDTRDTPGRPTVGLLL